jgi:hypothetical protein
MITNFHPSLLWGKAKGFVSAGLALALALVAANAAFAEPIEVRSSRIPLYPDRPQDTRAGNLIYRGGLVLSSTDNRFGGWSDLAVSADGSEILAISDAGRWMKAHLTYGTSGNLIQLTGADIAPMRDPAGQPLTGREADAEGLSLERANDLTGPVVVSFEGQVRVWRYDLSRGLDARPTNLPIGDWVKRLHSNAQLEAITVWKPDTLIAFAEKKVGSDDDLLAAFEAYPGDGRPHTRLLSVVPHDPFAITSAANAPDGGLYLLERRFTLPGGIGMEVRHIPRRDIREGARLQGEVIANLSYQDANIDNMEGLAMRRGPRGETLLYVISDDNFFALQRTLLLTFEVKTP